MGRFNHTNIIRLEGVVTKRRPIMIVMELMDNGCLHSLLRKRKERVEKFTDKQLVIMLQGIASGMQYLAKKHFVHRDLAARNVLVSRTFECKVSDFGLSRKMDNKIYGSCVYESKEYIMPIRWSAPEVLQERKFTTASDVWSFGVVAWEIFSYGELPYSYWSELSKVGNKGCPDNIYTLMTKCWLSNWADRMLFKDIVCALV